MMEKFSVRLFGAFRSFSSNSEIVLEAKVPIRVSALKELVRDEIQRRETGKTMPGLIALMSDSAFATEECVLSPCDQLEHGCRLALMPPVCGG